MNKRKILKLYYEKHLTRKDIMKRLKLSGRYITTVIQQDPRYMDERERRKLETKIKAIERYQKVINLKKEDNYNTYKQMQIAHIQASKELSINKPISNIVFRNWNSSIYKFKPKDRTYRLKRNIKVGYDVPKKIMWH